MRQLAGAVALALLALDPSGPLRAAAPGELDPSFNGGAPLVLDFAKTAPRVTSFYGVAIDADGGLVVAGEATDPTGHHAVVIARLHADGSLDAAFGMGGSRIVQMGLGSAMNFPLSLALDVGPRPGGAGWLVAGFASASDDRTAGLIGAFDATGSPDIGFGSAGSLRSQPAGPAPASTSAGGGAFTSDGSTLLAGTIETDPMTGANRKLVVMKATPAGAIATGFGNQPGAYVGGFSETTDTGSYGAKPLVTAPGILVAGSTLDPLGGFELLLVRLTSAGALDGNFASPNGFVRVQVADPTGPGSHYSQGTALAVGPSGEIYVTGPATDGDGREAVAVTRFTPSGGLDGAFGTGGTRRIQVATDTGMSAKSSPSAVAVQPDGKVLVAGFATDDNYRFHAVVLRLDIGGDLDPSFGTGGIARLDAGEDTLPGRVALTSDGGALVLVGNTHTGFVGSGLVERVLLVQSSTTTTTLPGGGCEPPPSIAGARCRIGLLASAVGASVPLGRLETRLAKTVARAGARLDGADGLAGRKRRARLRKASALVRRFARQLGSRAAVHTLPDAVRTDLRAMADAVGGELAMLLAAAG